MRFSYLKKCFSFGLKKIEDVSNIKKLSENMYNVKLGIYDLKFSSLESVYEIIYKSVASGDNKFGDIKLYDFLGNQYHNSILLSELLDKNFIISLSNHENYAVIQNNTTTEIEKIEDNNALDLNLKSLKIKSLLENSSDPGFENYMSNLLSKIFEKIDTIKNNNKIPLEGVNFCISNALSEAESQNSKIINVYSLIEETLLNQIKELEKIKDNITDAISKKAKRRSRLLSYFFIAQVAFMQYGTYYKYSWDIMEPISCLIGIADITIAYAFFLRNKTDYDLKNFEESFVYKKVNYNYRQLDSLIEEKKKNYESIKNIKNILSPDLNDFLEYNYSNN